MLRLTVIGVVLVLSLAGCGRPSGNPPASSFATVGGQQISASLHDYYIEQQTGVTPDKVSPELKKRLTDDLIALAAVADAGAKAETPRVQSAVELSRLEILANAAADAAGVNNPPDEADVEQAYRAYVAGLPPHEYHIAQILIPSRAVGEGLVKRLENGEKFADLARTASVDESRNRGGDMGWVAPGHLPQAFVDAMMRLRPGEYTHEPVQTPYGWHLIEVLEARTPAAPPIESVRAQVIANLKADRYRRFLDESVHRVAVKSLGS